MNNKNKFSIFIFTFLFSVTVGTNYGVKFTKEEIQHIDNNIIKIEKVYLFIIPENQEQETYKKIYKFYRHVGTTVDENNQSGCINLKDARYFDEQ